MFTVKRRPVLNHARVFASAREPYFKFLDFPQPGRMGELLGNREVRVAEKNGEVVDRRLTPRSAFRGLRRQFYWDDLDFIYFGGYATWNYLVTPFFFLRDGFHFDVLEPLGHVNSNWLRLRATFPAEVPTHCRTQTFYFDEDRHLRRLDYTAEVVGGWARAAHLCHAYRDFDGFKVPTQRQVLPLFWGGRPMPRPALVELEIHALRPIRPS